MSSLRMLEDRSKTGSAAAGRPRLIAMLTAIFNCFALNGLIVVACLPIVTIPASLRAGMCALDRWRGADDDRVGRVFWDALCATRWRTVTASIGAPISGAVLASLEVQHFSGVHSAADAVCLGLGVCSLLICVASVGYAIVLSARYELSALSVWSTAVSLAVGHAVGASLLLVAEIGLLGTLLSRDPALTVVCVPLALLALVRATAGRPIGRVAGAAAAPAVSEPGGATRNPDSGEMAGR